MTTWLPAALFALFNFGLWGLFTKLTINHIDSRSALVYQTMGVLIIGCLTYTLLGFKTAVNLKGVSFGLLTGITYGLGCLFYFIAADKGKIETVVTLTALYPLITIILSYILFREAISLKQCIGIVLALFAIFLLT